MIAQTHAPSVDPAVSSSATAHPSTSNPSIAALWRLLGAHKSFLLTSHARPDGDAVGSALAMMHLLEDLGKSVSVCFADPIPSIFNCLPGVDRISATLPERSVDVALLLECDSVARSGFRHLEAEITVNVDHHLSGRQFADFNWIDPEACAVAAMIYDLALAGRVNITPAIASCLYAAILTDTGSFTYATTDATTFEIARHLVESGAAATEIAQAIYFSVPPSRIRLLGAALTNMRQEGEVAWSTVTQAEIDNASASIEDCEGVVNYLIGMAGVRAAVFLREVAPGEQFLLSLRSKGSIDVAAVAEGFGGGGHRNSSGCTLQGPLQTASDRVIHALMNACREKSPDPVLS